MNRLKEIESRVSELEEIHEADHAREKRLLDVVAGAKAEQEKIATKPLAALLEKTGMKPADMEKFFKAEADDATKSVAVATDALKLTNVEIEHFQQQARAVALINPWALVLGKCQFHAAYCGSTHGETGNASGSCTCNTPNNECNPKVVAYGQGILGTSSAYVTNYCYFEIPARPTAAMVTVQAYVDLHGFYMLRHGPFIGSNHLSLDLELRGFQYGWSWGEVTMPVLNLSGNAMGRCDTNKFLQFSMPVGADPFLVRFSATMRAYGQSGGNVALGDFATGVGNFIKIYWVNTYS